jgi:hypothetical protein
MESVTVKLNEEVTLQVAVSEEALLTDRRVIAALASKRL